MTDIPDVSVVIAAFNAEHSIHLAIASALAQLDISVEVIVVDDASTDATCAVVKALGASAVRLLRRSQNGGPSAARNQALRAARGRWIAVLDADDSMVPTRLRTLIDTAEEASLDIVSDDLIVVDAQRRGNFTGEPLDEKLVYIGVSEFFLANMLFGSKPALGYLKPVFRKDFFHLRGIEYDEELRIGEDFLLIAEALVHGAKYARRRSAGYYYNIREGSLSRKLSAAAAFEMVAGDERLIARLGARLRGDDSIALGRHLSSLKDGAIFVGMVDALKAHRFLLFAAIALKRPAAALNFRIPVRDRLRRAVEACAARRQAASN